jgi:HlyD family secretion protein
MSSQIDLRELAYERSAPTAPTSARRRPIVSRYVVPGVVLLGFLGMIVWASRGYFVPRVPVSVIPVMVGRADVQPAGTSLFQAAGWVEPRPTAVLVSAMVDGVVAELLVVEGQSVVAGQPIARLIDIDAKLALRQAESELKLRETGITAAKAQLAAAEQRLKHPLHLQAALADAEATLTKSETELGKIPHLLKAAEARNTAAEQSKSNKESLDGLIAGRVIQQAQADYAIAAAELEELRERKPRLEKEIATLTKKREALQQQLSLLLDETRQVAEAASQQAAAEVRFNQAQLAVEQAAIQLERTTVKAPISGSVLALIARPGSRVPVNTIPIPGTPDNSGAIVSMYDPKQLQVRADVRPEDVRLVEPGQPVTIRTASVKEPIRGRVLLATSSANVQKNTLEVKVAIEDPPSAIRPEMLVTAEFLAPEKRADHKTEAAKQTVILVPRALVQKETSGASIWVAAPDGLAHRVTIRLGAESSNKMVEVLEGLTPTDKLIVAGRETLQAGMRVEITGEDRSFGTESQE